MTTPVAVSHCGLYGPGGDCGSIALRPHVWRRPLSSEPLLEADELNSYRISAKPCGAGVARRLRPPIQGGEQGGRPQDDDRVDEQGDHGQLHLAGLDLAAEVFRRAADHQAAEEDGQDEVQQQVDEADALAAEDAVEPHADERRTGRSAG